MTTFLAAQQIVAKSDRLLGLFVEERDEEMHQTKKGNQWYFGMKLHVGVDKDSGLAHSAVATAANAADVTMVEPLLHGSETEVFGDAGYTGVGKREEHADREE